MLQLVVPALAVIGIVVIGTKIFENASKREKEKQRDFYERANNEFRNLSNYEKKNSLALLNNYFNEVKENKNSLLEQIENIEEQIKNNQNLLKSSRVLFTPNYRNTVIYVIKIMQEQRDVLKSYFGYWQDVYEELKQIQAKILNNLQSTLDGFSLKIPVEDQLLIRGEVIIYDESELNSNITEYKHKQLEIADYRYKDYFINIINKEIKKIPTVLTRFEKGRKAFVSLASGRLYENESNNIIDFEAEIVSNNEKIIADYYGVKILVPKKALKRTSSDIKIGEKIRLFVWSSDRYYTNIIAGEIPPIESRIFSVESIWIVDKEEFFKDYSNVELSFLLAEYDEEKFLLVPKGSNRVFKIFLNNSNSKIYIEEEIATVKIDLSNYKFVEFKREIKISDENKFIDKMMLVNNIVLFTEYEKELKNQDNIKMDETMAYFDNLLFEIKEQRKKEMTVKVIIKLAKFIKENGCLYSVEIENLGNILSRYDKITDGFIGFENSYILALKIDETIYRIRRIKKNTIFLEENDCNIFFGEKEAVIFSLLDPIIDKQIDSIERLKKGRLKNHNIQKAIMTPDYLEKSKKVKIEKFFSEKITETQKQAVSGAMATEDIFLIQGPPGTGKTTTIMEIIKQQLFLNKKSRILLTSQSHIAIDNALEKVINGQLIADDLIARYGSKSVKEKITPTVLKYFKELNIVENAQIVGITTMGITGIGYEKLGEFDLVIVDEAARATYPETIPAIIFAQKCIIVGDHKQLPPVGFVEEEFYNGLDTSRMKESMFEKLFNTLPEDRKIMLDEQFRMAPKIGRLVSELFYEEKLRNGEKNEEDRILDFQLGWISSEDFKSEKDLNQSTSNYNEASEIIKFIFTRNLNNKDIAIITPYKAQKELIENMLIVRKVKDKIKIATVDSFQGQEADIVIFSGTKTTGMADFIADKYRFNVSLSRAKQTFIFFGNKKFFLENNSNIIFKKIYENCEMTEDTRVSNISMEDNENEMIISENKLRDGILLITIGQRDIMGVYSRGNKLVRYRCDDNFDELMNKQLFFLEENNILEEKPENKDVLIGKCFPMIEKSINLLKKKDIMLKKIILVYTDRGESHQQLTNLNNLFKMNNFGKAENYSEKLKEYALKDKTKSFADNIEVEMKNISFSHKMGLNLECDVIKIGVGSEIKIDSDFINDMIENNKEADIIKELSKFDINNGEFLYPEIYKKLKQLTKIIKNNNIYLSLYGGMPAIQRILLQIINTMIGSGEVEQLYFPEKINDISIISKDYYSYFERLKSIEEKLVRFNISEAIKILQFFQKIDTENLEKYNRIILELRQLEGNEIENVFTKFYFKLLKEIYNGKIENVILGLSIFLEETLKKVVKTSSDKCNWEIVTENSKEYIKFENEKYEIGLMKIRKSNLPWKNSNVLEKYMKLLLEIKIYKLKAEYIEKGELKYSHEEIYKKILNIPNNVIHNMIIALNENDIEKITELEKSFFVRNSIFYRLAEIYGINMKVYSFEYRARVTKIIEDLYEIDKNI